jgi:creatinine amidohydrolase
MTANPSDRADQVQWERLLPAEFQRALDDLPTVYLPLGTVEWHGLHNALGLDALKAHALCVMAARRGGGIVHPVLYGGMGGLDKPATVVMEPELSWDNHLLRPWLEKLCSEFHRQGFRAVIMLTGHYGHNQQIVVKETAARMTERLGIPVLGAPEYWLALDAGYTGDHAGIGETSLMMYLHPELVAMDRIGADPDYGADDRIAKGASAELGQRYAEAIVDRLARLGRSMPSWTADARAAFAQAERSLVSVQVTGWRNQGEWSAWRKLAASGLVRYGELLVEQKFAEIERLAATMLA